MTNGSSSTGRAPVWRVLLGVPALGPLPGYEPFKADCLVGAVVLEGLRASVDVDLSCKVFWRVVGCELGCC